MTERRGPSPYTLAFAVLMAIAAGEALFFASLIGQLRADNSIASLGGPQRMRTQRIAFLSEQAIDPGLTPPERDELVRSIDTFRMAQRELDGDAATRIGTPISGGSTDLENAVDRYAAAANEVLAHPKTATAANAYVLTNRLPLLSQLDAAVETYKTRSAERSRFIWGFIIGLLVLMTILVVTAWLGIAVPLERHLSKSREQLRSLFEDNPEAVTTYDLDGRVVDANPAAAALAGHTMESLRGQTFSGSIVQELRSDAFLAFARSAAGDPAKFETTLVRPDGVHVDVSASLVPSIVDGRIDGVYSVARDVTQERTTEREIVEQSKRIRELYLVAAASGGSGEDQIVRALEVGCDRLGLQWGFVAHLDRSVATIRASVGSQTFGTGKSIRIDKNVIRKALGTNDVVVIGDVGKHHLAVDPGDQSDEIGTFVAFPIVVASKPYGAVGFASARTRETPVSESDKDFIRLIGALIGASIERAEAKRRLDAMAFSDSLTGLPNRASLDASIEELIVRARRSDDRFSVHFIDLDGFKAVNDDHGHSVGDELLRVIAERVRTCISENDIAARLGGDEFIILQPGAHRRADAGALAARIIDAIGKPVTIDGAGLNVGSSIGIACYPADGSDVKTLFANADKALYRAKSSGRGRYDYATATDSSGGSSLGSSPRLRGRVRFCDDRARRPRETRLRATHARRCDHPSIT